MARFLIACGGTGGHLSPGIAVAERLIQHGNECLLVISAKRVDQRLSEKYPHLKFERITGRAFSVNPFRFVRFAIHQIGALLQTFLLFRRERPAAVIAFGGFMSLGVVLAAFFCNTPIALHEANRRPGRAIRLLRGLATVIYVPEGVKLNGVSVRTLRNQGYPLRKEISRQSREAARRTLGFSAGGRLLLVLGGSQGASALNEWVRTHADVLAREDVNIYCVTGLGKGSESVLELKADSGDAVRIVFTSFSDQMATLLSAADLVVSRAGAGSVAEMVQCLTPSILIPYPHAADNHQLENARFLERQGGCVVLEQENIDRLLGEVRDMLFNDWMLDRLRQNLRQLRRGDAATAIATELENLAREKAESNTKPASINA